MRATGMRWTPQRRLLVEVLTQTDGHITGSELLDRCRRVDPATTPSTVYRTLAVLEELGYVRHAHAADGREEFHVLPAAEHGHLHCEKCGRSWDLSWPEIEQFAAALDSSRGFELDLSHVTVSGRCSKCRTGER